MFEVPTPSAIKLGADILAACGASESNASEVAAHLVESERMGVSSHGMARLPQYVSEIKDGLLDPAASPVVDRRAGAVTAVDGRWTFGIVGGEAAAAEAGRSARKNGIGLASVRCVRHTGRLGAFSERLAREGCLAMVFASGDTRFKWIAPFGGKEGRMSTNPISWAAPASGDPLVADFASSIMPEGKIRLMRDRGEPVPPDVIIDAEGRPAADPEALYADPPGTLLPLGGARYGHKGYALALLVQIMSALLVEDNWQAGARRGNSLTVLAVHGGDHLPEAVSELVSYLKSSPPVDPDRPVLMPGEIEARNKGRSRRVRLADDTRRNLAALASRLQVDAACLHRGGQAPVG